MMNNSPPYLLDKRTKVELQNELRRLAASFTPEWQFDTQNPDIGSVIGLIFTGQMGDNIARMNQVLGKYHTEFVNMLALSLLPAYPATGMAIIDLIPGAVPGLDVARGTQLLSYNEDGSEPIVFETGADVHITGARMREIFMASSGAGKLIPLKGNFTQQSLEQAAGIVLPAEDSEALEETEEPATPATLLVTEESTWEEELSQAPGFVPEPLPFFQFSAQGIQQNALFMYHETVFSTAAGADILLRFSSTSGSDLSNQLANPALYKWQYYNAKEGLIPFAEVRAEEGILHLSRTQEADRVSLLGKQYALVCVQALEPVTQLVQADTIVVASRCDELPAQFVSSNGQDLSPARFMPFGDSVSLFDECYIGHDEVFAQQGATIQLTFRLSSQEKLVTMTPEQKEAELKVIKRRTSFVPFVTVDTAPEKVSFEYYSGAGWRRLQMYHDCSDVFNGTHGGTFTLSFLCPADWEPMAVGFEGRSIRIRVTQADNCYLQPCRHHMPLIENLCLSYSYQDNWRPPQRIRRLCGTAITDLTTELTEKKPLGIFAPLPYAEDAVYLGFDQKIESGPVSIFFEMEHSGQFTAPPIRFEYSTAGGFVPLKNVVDNTQNLSRTGTVVFLPPAGFAPYTFEGKRRWWLRLVDASGSWSGAPRVASVVRQILPNAVPIQNTETMDEEYFYLEAATPGMSFPLSAQRILSAEVFVNEYGQLRTADMQALLEQHPEDVRAEYNLLGEIVSFYMRWEETENFDDSSGYARHYVIDRMNGRICFGDGIQAALPAVRDEVAFTVQCTCCNGQAGNLPAGAINSFYGNVLYVDRVYNPSPTSAGSDLESLERAHNRGANIISSKNRLVSEGDFVREVLACSDSIHKVRCVIGQDPHGKKQDKLVSLTVLLKEYQNNAQAFDGLRKHIYNRLLARCEATLNESSLSLYPPTFVTLTVDAYGVTHQKEERFALRAAYKQKLTEYIDPVLGNQGTGWNIGVFPTRANIAQMLYALHTELSIQHFTATIQYTDQTGIHECELDKMPISPFMLAVSGPHQLHFLDR